jgi:DNA-binding transcriptional ArsR family regulator
MSNDTKADVFPTPPAEAIDLVTVLKALADPARLAVVTRLSDGEYHPCTPDEYGLALHKSTLSFHFKTLREAGVTATLVEGRNHAVRLRREDLDSRFPGLMTGVLTAAGPSRPAA